MSMVNNGENYASNVIYNLKSSILQESSCLLGKQMNSKKNRGTKIAYHVAYFSSSFMIKNIEISLKI